MTRKDYEMIALNIRSAREMARENKKSQYVINQFVDLICSDLERDNSAFDRDRFVEACR